MTREEVISELRFGHVLCSDKYLEAVNMAIRSLEAWDYDRDQYMKGYQDAFPKWTPCSEKQPEKEGQYLVTLDFAWGKEIEMGDWFIFEDGHGEWVNPNSHVTVAWMELPEAWKESGDKEC